MSKCLNSLNSNKIPCRNAATQFYIYSSFQPDVQDLSGVTEDSKAELYLRPETAQGIFVNFRNVLRTSRKKTFWDRTNRQSIPQRDNPGQFYFPNPEFEQMELEFFCKPGEDMEWFKYWKDFCKNWLLSLGMNENNIRMRDHPLKSCPTTALLQLILNTCFLDGARYGA